MPGRAKRGNKTAAPRRPAASNQSYGDLEQELAIESSWQVIVTKLCEYFDLPKLEKRSGLKKVHVAFDTIYKKLDDEYNRNINHPTIPCGIVGIFAKMCSDALLMRKLFNKGLISKISKLLDKPDLRHVLLVALSTITRHGGTEARHEIITLTPKIVKLMENYPDDPRTIDPAVATLSHSLGALIQDEKISDQNLFNSLRMAPVIQAMVKVARNSTSSAIALDHAFGLLAGAALHFSSLCKKTTGTVDLMVATLRSQDWVTRVLGLRFLLCLHHFEGEPDQRHMDPMKVIANYDKGIPPHLSRILNYYGAQRCDIYYTLKSMSEGTNLMMKCAQDKNLYNLGIRLAENIVLTEWSVPLGGYQTMNSRTGQMELLNPGLPFKMWQDCLPHCAKAIREKGNPDEADMADILDLKYYIISARYHEAISLANESLKRSQHAYFYYAISMGNDTAAGLRAAKKGMKCKKTAPFVHYQLMQRAVQFACDRGILAMQGVGEIGDKPWEEGIAFFISAWNDARTYIHEAPPDTRHMKSVCYWYILLTLTIEGPKLKPDLSELEFALKVLKTADEFSVIFGVQPPKTFIRMAQATAVKHYKKAEEEWRSVMTRYDHLIAERSDYALHEHSEDGDLQNWLDEVQTEEGIVEESIGHVHPRVSANSVDLYQCTWCKNPSAVLKKCSGCGKTRYCDITCQKSHWSTHKAYCKAS